MGFLCVSASKESTCNEGDLGLIPGLGRSPGEVKNLPTPVFWSGEFHGLYSLYDSWAHKESDMTEQLLFSLSFTYDNIIFSCMCIYILYLLSDLSLFYILIQCEWHF